MTINNIILASIQDLELLANKIPKRKGNYLRINPNLGKSIREAQNEWQMKKKERQASMTLIDPSMISFLRSSFNARRNNKKQLN